MSNKEHKQKLAQRCKAEYIRGRERAKAEQSCDEKAQKALALFKSKPYSMKGE